MAFKEIAPEELMLNPFTKIGKEWMLITAGADTEHCNTMTASWGAMGVMWGKNVVSVYIRPQRYTKEFIDASFDEIIEFAELKDFVDMPLKNFSSGMVARIAFAIATITEPDILIVDETLSVGDVFFQQKCERRIQHFIESGDVTVLFVSHSMEQVERICQRAVWIEKGDLRMDGPVDEVCKAYHDQFK